MCAQCIYIYYYANATHNLSLNNIQTHTPRVNLHECALLLMLIRVTQPTKHLVGV